jgi:hypothetical protein
VAITGASMSAFTVVDLPRPVWPTKATWSRSTRRPPRRHAVRSDATQGWPPTPERGVFRGEGLDVRVATHEDFERGHGMSPSK